MKSNRSIEEALEVAAKEGRVTVGGKQVGTLFAPTTALPDAKVSEKDFQRAVIELAEREGWLVYHTFDSRRSEPGFPDLVIVRERVIWMELKVHPNTTTAEQLSWIDALKAANQPVYVFYPEDFPIITNLLRGVS